MFQTSQIFVESPESLKIMRPNLKNLSRGLNLSREKYGWFHLKLYSIFHDLGRRSIETVF